MKRALALLALATCGQLAGATDSPPILERMLEAARTLNYRGHVVQIEGTQAQTLHLLHRAGRDAGEDRVHSLQGAYWELLRTGARCRVAMSDARQPHDEAIVAAAFPSLVPERLLRLTEFYEFTPIGTGRFADRKAEFTLTQPRDGYRFAHLLVTDAASGLLLKAGLVDQRGQMLRQVFFVDLQLLPALTEAEWRQPEHAAPAALTWTEHNLKRAPAPVAVPWQIGPLPPGFAVSGYARRPMPGSEIEVEQITLSDGLATVSVFIDTQATADKDSLGARHVAAMPAFDAAVAGRHVTVLGAAPFPALRQIAGAIGPRPSDTPSAPPSSSADAP